LLDANVFAYLQAHRKNAGAYSYSAELVELLHCVHRRQLRVDASFAAMERGLLGDELVTSQEKFTEWLDDFYEGKALFKNERVKIPTGPIASPMHYLYVSAAWEEIFLPSYATLLKALSLAEVYPDRKDLSRNVLELFEWCDLRQIRPGISANLAIGLFAKEQQALKVLKYTRDDSAETKDRKARNAARDVTYYVRLLNIHHQLPLGGLALYVTADLAFASIIEQNALLYYALEGDTYRYACAPYPALAELLTEAERAIIENPFSSESDAPAFASPAQLYLAADSARCLLQEHRYQEAA